MDLSDDIIETLHGVLQSYLAAAGDPFDDIQCPELNKAWKALQNKHEEPKSAVRWVRDNCKFSQSKDTVTIYDKKSQEVLIGHQSHLGVFNFSSDHPAMRLYLSMDEMEVLLRKIKVHTGRDCGVVFE